VRKAACDLRYGHDSVALDAIEFLRDNGRWLCRALFDMADEDYKREIAVLVIRRQRSTGRTFLIPKYTGGDELG
jgi:hypothetical protein